MPSRRAPLVRELCRALVAGDDGALGRILSWRVTVVVDSGGRMPAARHPVRGSKSARRMLATLLAERPGVTMAEHPVNGEPGIVLREAGRVVGVIAVGIHRSRITHLWIVVNPDKLRRWNGA